VSTTFASSLRRGALAGVLGGVAGALTLVVVGERSIAAAIDLEAARAVPGEAHDELFTRTTQVIGGSLGLALYGLFLGVVFAVVFAAVQHRLGAGPTWRRARRLAALAFVAVFLAPFLKYPANPPAVGDPDTVNQRTIAYVSMVAISIAAVLLAAVLHERLARRGVPEWYAQPAAALVWVTTLAVAFVALPPNPDAIEVPADLLWSFRLASLGGQAALWAVVGTVFAVLCARADRPVDVAAPAGADRPTGAASA
jgi:predicted cobalt transporter CbtA